MAGTPTLSLERRTGRFTFRHIHCLNVRDIDSEIVFNEGTLVEIVDEKGEAHVFILSALANSRMRRTICLQTSAYSSIAMQGMR